jgi:hypothetical protein
MGLSSGDTVWTCLQAARKVERGRGSGPFAPSSAMMFPCPEAN